MTVTGVQAQVTQLVDTTVNAEEAKAPPEAAVPEDASVAPGTPVVVKEGDKYGGITKQSDLDAKKKVDGFWNKGDSTGNEAADAVLNKFADANASNPKALAATESAAAEVREHPEKYVNPDGTINKGAFSALLNDKLGGLNPPVVVPPPTTPFEEGIQAQGAAPGESAQKQEGAVVGGGPGSTMTVQSSGIAYKNLGSLADGDVMAMAFIVIMEAAKSAREDLKSIMDGVKAINKEKEGWRKVSETVNSLAAKGAGKNDDYNINPDLTSDKNDLDGTVADPTKGLRNAGMGAWNAGDVSHDKIWVNSPGPDGTMVAGGFVIQGTDGKMLKKDIDNAKETVKNKLDSLSEMGEMESLRLQMAMDRLSKLMSTISNLLKKASDTGQSITQNLK